MSGQKAINSILNSLEPSRKFQQDSSDAELVEVFSKTITALEYAPDAGMALEALPELMYLLEVKMKEAGNTLDSEVAAALRDRVKRLRTKLSGQ